MVNDPLGKTDGFHFPFRAVASHANHGEQHQHQSESNRAFHVCGTFRHAANVIGSSRRNANRPVGAEQPLFYQTPVCHFKHSVDGPDGHAVHYCSGRCYWPSFPPLRKTRLLAEKWTSPRCIFATSGRGERQLGAVARVKTVLIGGSLTYTSSGGSERPIRQLPSTEFSPRQPGVNASQLQTIRAVTGSRARPPCREMRCKMWIRNAPICAP